MQILPQKNCGVVRGSFRFDPREGGGQNKYFLQKRGAKLYPFA